MRTLSVLVLQMIALFLTDALYTADILTILESILLSIIISIVAIGANCFKE
jgi:hypothetical protein